MESFVSQKFSCRYRSGDSESSPRHFYNKVLASTKLYCRAVGFFSSSSFLEISYGILGLVKNDGKMLLITSPKLNQDDVEAINRGYEARENVYLKALKRSFILPENIDSRNRLNVLANLIELGILEIKIAVTENPQYGMYHEKIGIFIDNEGNEIAISGSNNESENAITDNFESFQVFCGWKGEDSKERVSVCKKDFYAMWENNQSDLKIYTFPELPKAFIQAYKTTKVPLASLKGEDLLEIEKIEAGSEDVSKLFFNFPENINPRDYQKKAIRQFVDNNFQCLFAMATGTGKTLTSLFAVNELSCLRNITSVIIIVPLKDLVDQWASDISKAFSGEIIQIHSGVEWKTKISDLTWLKLTETATPRRIVMVTTYDSFSQNNERIMSVLGDNSVIIADEVHKFGANYYSKKMPEKLHYRIGLSATPKRAFDDQGTKAVFDYFCPNGKSFVFGIKEAIAANMLCRYNYVPKLVKLTEEEMAAYDQISDKISKQSFFVNSSNATEQDWQKLEQLLKERHRIIERAENKKEIFIQLMLSELQKYSDKTIVFCPDGTNDDKQDLLYIYKTELWQKCMQKGKIIRMNEYVQGTPKSIIDDFSKGAIHILFAKQRLNEGIDIPSARRAVFISSSTSEREFIQRRGRVLRKSPGKNLAEIFDFIVIPPDRNSRFASSIIEGEIKRAMDFAETAENYSEIETILNKYL